MNQSCFSLGFLSQNYLWKLSTFRGYKDIYSRMYEECERSVSSNKAFWRLDLAIGKSRESESRANCLARLEVLSCNATAGVTLQLPLHASHVCHSGDLPVTRSSRKAPLNCTLLKISSHSLRHYPYMIPT